MQRFYGLFLVFQIEALKLFIDFFFTLIFSSSNSVALSLYLYSSLAPSSFRSVLHLLWALQLLVQSVLPSYSPPEDLEIIVDETLDEKNKGLSKNKSWTKKSIQNSWPMICHFFANHHIFFLQIMNAKRILWKFFDPKLKDDLCFSLPKLIVSTEKNASGERIRRNCPSTVSPNKHETYWESQRFVFLKTKNPKEVCFFPQIFRKDSLIRF